MQSNLTYSFKLLQVVSWILFVGLAIDAGGYLSNTLFTIFINPACAAGFWGDLDLSHLYTYNFSFFCIFTSILIIISVLKTLLFYFTVKVFHEKQLNLIKPFNELFNRYLFRFAFLALAIGLFCYIGKSLLEWLNAQNVAMPAVELVKMGGSDVWLFMGITLLVFAQLFKKGIELQSENDLTV